MHAPYFLLEVNIETDDGPYIRHIVSADVRMVIHTASLANKGARLQGVSLLSPEYMNGTNGYALDRLAELWSSDEDSFTDLLFVLADGRTQRFATHGTPACVETMKLVADFRQLGKTAPLGHAGQERTK